MYKVYIFDLDGTLLDTLQDLADSVNYALRQHGMPEHSIDDIRRFVGNGVRRLMERAIPDGAQNPSFDAVFADFRRYYMQHSLDTTRPYDGIPELLHALKARGCRLAVVSNKMMAATQLLVAHFFPEIDVAIGEHEAEGIRKKPAPDTVLEALRQLGLPLPPQCPQPQFPPQRPQPQFPPQRPQPQCPQPQFPPQRPQPQCSQPQFPLCQEGSPSLAVYVGDSDVDIETAHNSGLPCISVLWGFRDRDFLLAHGATTFVEHPLDLLN